MAVSQTGCSPAIAVPAADSRTVTYSPAYTLVPTYECFNRCSYCNFRVDPGGDRWLEDGEAWRRLAPLAAAGTVEILILSGEVHPRSDRRGAWADRLVALGALALRAGFLPHTNAGPLSAAEMARLRSVNVSMGLMLEQVSPALQATVHRHAPSKAPALRLAQLEQAGRLRIPFTTGLLVGLGETARDRRDTLAAIARVQRRWGHIQEAIVQPHSAGSAQDWAGEPCDREALLATIRDARAILPEEVVVQVPPNLLGDREGLLAALEAGARDLGGIGPTDEVNPDYDHPTPERLRAVLEPAGWTLVPRLPVYPQYDRWLPRPLQAAVARWRDRLGREVAVG